MARKGSSPLPIGLTLLAAVLLATRARGPFRRTRRAARFGAGMAVALPAVLLANAGSTADVAARIAAHPPLLVAAIAVAMLSVLATLFTAHRRGRYVAAR